MLLDNETSKWRALLRLSNYITNIRSSKPTDIYNELLHEDIRNLSRNAKKHLNTFQLQLILILKI